MLDHSLVNLSSLLSSLNLTNFPLKKSTQKLKWVAMPSLPSRQGQYLVYTQGAITLAFFHRAHHIWQLAYCPDLILTVSHWTTLPQAIEFLTWPPRNIQPAK